MLVYLDSVPLTASRWPSANADLKRLVEAAALAQPAPAIIFIPEPVALEQEAQFMRNWRKDAAPALPQAQRTVKGFTSRVGLPDIPAANVPPDVDVLTAYRAAAAASMRELGFTSVPFVDVPVREIFDALLRRDPPFDSNGKGLGDPSRTLLEYYRTEGRSQNPAWMPTGSRVSSTPPAGRGNQPA